MFPNGCFKRFETFYSLKSAGRAAPQDYYLRIISKILTLSLLILYWVVHDHLMAQSPGMNDAKEQVHVVFSDEMVKDLNKSDAKASIKVLANHLAVVHQVPINAETEVFDGIDSLTEAVLGNKAHIVALRMDEYLDMGLEDILIPSHAGVYEKGTTEEFLLIQHQSFTDSNLSQLRGKSLKILMGARTGLSKVWLDSLLLAEGLPESHLFFSEIQEAGKLSNAVLPVFFGQSDSCLITRSGFETMSEMNPQIQRNLRIIASSPPVLPSLVCISRMLNPELRGRITEALGEIHQTPKGQQVLMLFKMNQLVPVDESQIKESRALLSQYRKLKAGNPIARK